MEYAKVRLSKEELELVQQTEWILTKNRVMLKAKNLLQQLQEIQVQATQPFLDRFPELAGYPLKISRGENYRGLPYLVLDYPRFFQTENIFAIRTMFWWGNFFSVTLHLGGSVKKQLESAIESGINNISTKDLFISVGESQWEYHYEKDNYLPLANCSKEQLKEIIAHSSFMKLSGKIPLEKWDSIEEQVTYFLSQFTTLLNV